MEFQKVRFVWVAWRSPADITISKIRFLGGKLGEAIASQYDVSTVGDLL